MNQKSERERHNYALTTSFILTAVVAFFIISSWYYRISGESLDTSFFTDIEEMYNKQKTSFEKLKGE